MADELPTYREALMMLADKAQQGSVTAIVALERALRNQGEPERDELDATIRQLLRDP